MNKKGSIALIILGLVAVIALVGLVWVSGTATTGQATLACTDSDGGAVYDVQGTVITPKGSVTDTCLDKSRVAAASGPSLLEMFCKEDGTFMKTINLCPNGCSNGACVAAPAVPVCTDSDGGAVYDVQGTVITPKGRVTDTCLDKSSVAAASGPSLLEMFCKEDGTFVKTAIKCPNSCSNGACLTASQAPVPAPVKAACTDTDGGLVYDVKGTVITPKGSVTDTCMDKKGFAVTNGPFVLEMYCKGGAFYKIKRSCSNGCINGACV